MKAALYNLPTELITTILIDYEAHELLYVNRWFYEVGIEDFCTGELYSPKTLKEGPIEQQLHDYYTFISSLNPGSLYTNSIEKYYLNLEHFDGSERLSNCLNLADFISYFPKLEKLVLTLHRLRDQQDDVSRLIGESSSCTDLTVNIEYVDDVSVDRLAHAILNQYPNLATLRLQRPPIVHNPGLDLDRQEKFVASVNAELQKVKCGLLAKPTAILFKNYAELVYDNRSRYTYTAETDTNYIHIYKWNKKQGYKEATKSKSKALAEYYPECVGKPLGNMQRKRRSDTDPLSGREFDILDYDIQALAQRHDGYRDEIRCAIDERDRENSRYRYYSVDDKCREAFGIEYP